MASKKTWKRRAKMSEDEAKTLFLRLGERTAELQSLDDYLRKAELPGPTLDEWAYQIREFFRGLLALRGIVPQEMSGTGVPIQPLKYPPNSVLPDPVGDGTYELPTPDEVRQAIGEDHFS